MIRVFTLLVLLLCVACDSLENTDTGEEVEDHIATASRRITLPAIRDTLHVGAPFKLQASVDCHNPIIGIRIEFTDGALGQGDGSVLGQVSFPARGTNSFEMDTVLTVPSLSERTPSDEYGFILVEIYEGREYRAGFEPITILNE